MNLKDSGYWVSNFWAFTVGVLGLGIRIWKEAAEIHGTYPASCGDPRSILVWGLGFRV